MIGNTNSNINVSEQSSDWEYYVLASNGWNIHKIVSGYGGGTGKYLLINNLISTENYEQWEIELTYTHGFAVNNWNGIISQAQSDYSGLTLHVRSSNQVQINLKNSGDSWIIGDTYVGLTVEKGITYQMKLVYDGTKDSNQYSFYYKTNPDDEWINSWNYTSSNKNYQAQKFALIGNENISTYNRGNNSILSAFKFTGDGVLVFDLSSAVEGVDFTNHDCIKLENQNVLFWG